MLFCEKLKVKSYSDCQQQFELQFVRQRHTSIQTHSYTDGYKHYAEVHTHTHSMIYEKSKRHCVRPYRQKRKERIVPLFYNKYIELDLVDNNTAAELNSLATNGGQLGLLFMRHGEMDFMR